MELLLFIYRSHLDFGKDYYSPDRIETKLRRFYEAVVPQTPNRKLTMQTFSRRNLIKAAGLSSVFGMLGLSFDPLQAAEHAKGVKLNPKMKDGWHYGHCRMCMRGTCPNMYRVENGIAVEIMGNPATPTTRGALCAKGQSILQNTYNAYRV